jgi:hypothetical protein
MKKNYIFRFKTIKFMTNDGAGDDDHVNHLLNTKFGNLVYSVRASSREEAHENAISHVFEITGFKILDADYDLTMT